MFAFKNNQLLKNERYIYILERGYNHMPKSYHRQLVKEMEIYPEYELIYFPDIFSSISHEVAEYCFPGLDLRDLEGFIAGHTEEILRSIEVPEHRYGIRYCVHYNKGLDMFEYRDISDEHSVWWIGQFAMPNQVWSEEGVRFRIVREEDKFIIPAEKGFEKALSQAELDAADIIKKIVDSGVSIVALKAIINNLVKPSRILITKQGKLFLTDYRKEIKMSPLPKTIFLFYLRHPEGCHLTNLMDHKDELYRIYQSISVLDDLDKMKESIDRLTDPFDNSICEKCSAVRSAFLKVVDDDIAKKYYISGPQGEAKKIPLDRNLVDWELEI